jgi:putative exosortase-associated protein (TIGR04073 family)
MRKTRLPVSIVLIFAGQFFLSLPAHAGYWGNMAHDFGRGIVNIVSSPLEIPITIQKYHESSGYPVVRHVTGLFDGTFRMVKRAGSGLWDFVIAIIPGDQEGVPPTPETLF